MIYIFYKILTLNSYYFLSEYVIYIILHIILKKNYINIKYFNMELLTKIIRKRVFFLFSKLFPNLKF